MSGFIIPESGARRSDIHSGKQRFDILNGLAVFDQTRLKAHDLPQSLSLFGKHIKIRLGEAFIGAVLVNRTDFCTGNIPVELAVPENDACFTPGIVVSVDGQNGIDAGRKRRPVLLEIRAAVGIAGALPEVLLFGFPVNGKRGFQIFNVPDINICHIINGAV